MREAVLVGLIGANIGKSLSPSLFEDACRAVGLIGHYHLMDLDRLVGRDLPTLLAAARTAGFAGLNVTYPCKEAVVPLLDALSAEAREIGAVNTVVFDRDGRAAGHNTDRTGFRRSVEETIGRDRVAGRTVLLVGAGGAGRAAAFALFDLGLARLLVADLDPAQAKGLVAAVGFHRCEIVHDGAAALARADGMVNATPVGMAGGPPGMSVPAAELDARHWLADVVYTPLETELVLAGRARGAVAMGGAGMCIHQAAESFSLFTGCTADLGRMRQTFAAAAARRGDSRVDAG
ncbi:MAG: shikimate dehydrogenase [Enhydrobacter sp.]|nr:MAG: shikimate dehydrogenase [Enhydrobacter sp.]